MRKILAVAVGVAFLGLLLVVAALVSPPASARASRAAMGGPGSGPFWSRPTHTRTPTRTSVPTHTPTRTPTPTPTPQFPCAVQSVQEVLPNATLAPPMTGFGVPGNLVVQAMVPPTTTATPQPPYAGVSQIYTNNGTRTNPVCLSCSPPPGSGAPAPGLYKNQPALRPQLDWIIAAGEMASHPPWVGGSGNATVEENNGWWADLWATTVDGSHWYNLTNYTVPSGAGNVTGVLTPRFSPDGS